MIRTSQVPYLGHEGHGVAVLLLGLRRRVQAGLQDCAGVQVQGAEAHLRLPKLLLHSLALRMGQDSKDSSLGQLCFVCISLFLVLLLLGEIPGLAVQVQGAKHSYVSSNSCFMVSPCAWDEEQSWGWLLDFAQILVSSQSPTNPGLHCMQVQGVRTGLCFPRLLLHGPTLCMD